MSISPLLSRCISVVDILKRSDYYDGIPVENSDQVYKNLSSKNETAREKAKKAFRAEKFGISSFKGSIKDVDFVLIVGIFEGGSTRVININCFHIDKDEQFITITYNTIFFPRFSP